MAVKTYLGLGSNDGDRLLHLERALVAIRALARDGRLRVSPIYETPALLPERAPPDWNRPYLNLVVEAEFDAPIPETLEATKKIELSIGRKPSERWAPRIIDIDLLLWGQETIEQPGLKIPHPELVRRAFTLDPLKDLIPNQPLPLSGNPTALTLSKTHPQHSPLWMGILNVTPDSFSETGPWNSENLAQTLAEWDQCFVGIIDVGAESTRPGATRIEPADEWNRLEPVLRLLQSHYQGRAFRPLISVDTRHTQTALRALEFGVDWINDVSGAADPELIRVLRDSSASYVLMHSLSIPADPRTTLAQADDPITVLTSWFKAKTREIEEQGLPSDRIIIDPGIGFGKTALQSLDILKGLRTLSELPYRLLVGHSRKSFLNPFTSLPAPERDLESIGVSLNLAGKGVDILRVHRPVEHIRAFRAWNHINRSEP